MKKLILLLTFACISTLVSAQLKKDGSPDMRYNTNRATYGSAYTSPTYVQSIPSAVYQRSYERNGTMVEESYHTRPNNTNTDNWSTTGNTNPLTNERGSRAQDYSTDALNYGRGQVIQTGPRGGQYYENSNGNRVYVPKRPN